MNIKACNDLELMLTNAALVPFYFTEDNEGSQPKRDVLKSTGGQET